MKIGKIRFRIESIGGVRYFFGRPIGSETLDFPAVRGICQVVYVEKNEISQNYELNTVYETFALFETSITEEQFLRSYCKVNVIPISEEAFNVLNGQIQGRRDYEHAFKVED